MDGEIAARMVGRTVGGMARGTVGGMVSLATRQTPQIGGWGCDSNQEIGFVSLRASEAVCEREGIIPTPRVRAAKISYCCSCSSCVLLHLAVS